ncbi:MAG: class I SAM-dependent methyltransferase [Actinomycetes bacterium]
MDAAAAEQIRAHFDELADDEWHRLVQDPSARVSLEVHRRFLARFVRPGDRVLEIGAGPGRFTIELAALGARVVVTDVSPVQLRLNEHYVAEAGCADAVEDRLLLDVRDTGELGDGSFDLVLAYGGPLSYVFDDARQALAGLLRLVVPGREVVASVMSTLGTWRALLELVESEGEQLGHDSMDAVLRTGDLRPTQPLGHVCQMYRWSQAQQLVSSAGGRVLAASASNWASLDHPALVERIAADPRRWELFVDQEVRACSEPGALDGGTHLLFSAVQG